MKIVSTILIIGFLFAAYAQTPVFRSPVFVTANGSQIDVSWYGSPFYYDWTGDGVKDLVIGQFSSGYVRVYPNSGTDINPVFTNYSFLQADGRNISVYAS